MSPRTRSAGNDPDREIRRSTKRLLACGAVAGPLFVTVFLVEGARRPAYDPRRHPVSSLALGPGGWHQSANFVLAGALHVAGAVGLIRGSGRPGGSRAGSVLVGASGVGLIGSGVFVTDPVSGYPPGTPSAPAAYTRSGLIHDLSAVPTFLGLPAAQILFMRSFLRDGERRWGLYCAGSAAVMFTSFVLAGAAFAQVRRLVAYGGLFQRASVITGFGWLTGLLVRSARATEP